MDDDMFVSGTLLTRCLIGASLLTMIGCLSAAYAFS